LLEETCTHQRASAEKGKKTQAGNQKTRDVKKKKHTTSSKDASGTQTLLKHKKKK